MGKYELKVDDACHAGIMNTEKNKFVCLVETKRPDLGFKELEEIIDKANWMVDHPVAGTDFSWMNEFEDDAK